MCKDCILGCVLPIIKVKENTSTFEMQNQNRRKIDKMKIDGCVITKGVRCDWMFIDQLSKKEIYVELKGRDVEHAYDQITQTVTQLTKTKESKNGIIVCTKCPLTDTKSQVIKAKARKQNIVLTIKSRIYTDTIERLIQ
ncbi:hypothetical protein [Enterobacter cloacae]|uniref:hypothetical protein n=1 Tax=Enterobacter cloacae TaxID=550 RepID=UPI003315BA01